MTGRHGIKSVIEQLRDDQDTEEKILHKRDTRGTAIHEELEALPIHPRQETISSREHQALMSEKTTSDLDPD